MTSTIEKLKNQIQVKEQELSDLKAALRVFESLESDESTGAEVHAFAPKRPTPLTDTGEIDFDKLELPEKSVSSKPTVLTMSKEVIGKFSGKEFTVNHVYAALMQLGKVEENKHVKNRISMAVRKLADEGYLVRTHKGVGNEPHRYQEQAKQGSFLKSAPSEKT